MRCPLKPVSVVSLFLFAGMVLGQTRLDVSPSLDCLIEPHLNVNVSSAVEGVVESISVEKSDWVKKGQELAHLESSVERAAVAQARARAEMDGEVLARQTSFDFAVRKQERMENLFANKAISALERDEAATEVMLAKMELRRAKENRKLARLDYQRAIATLNRRTIRSPIAGVVVDRFTAAGEFVKEAPLLKLAVMDPLRVEVIVPATRFGSITEGMRAKIIPAQPGDRRYLATVTIVDQIIDAASGTFAVRMELPNPEYRIPGGVNCRIEFLPEKTADAANPGTRPHGDTLADANPKPGTEVAPATGTGKRRTFVVAANQEPVDIRELRQTIAVAPRKIERNKTEHTLAEEPEVIDTSVRSSLRYRLSTTDGLRLRSRPSTRSEVRRILPKGSRVEVLETRNDWSRVLTPEGIRGWIAARYLGNPG